MAEGPTGCIWIDGDACPKAIRERVERQALRRGRSIVLVTNQSRPAQMPDRVQHVRVQDNPDAADDYIAERVQPGDVVITDDTPLAARVVAAGGWALTTRGKIMSEANAQDRLATRDLLSGLRDQGLPIGGPSPFSAADIQRFAQALSQLLDRRPVL
jgi:uncharacterized protein YaiI (UPF0178 family)